MILGFRVYLNPQKDVECLPFGLYLGVLGLLSYLLWGPGRDYGSFLYHDVTYFGGLGKDDHGVLGFQGLREKNFVAKL